MKSCIFLDKEINFIFKLLADIFSRIILYLKYHIIIHTNVPMRQLKTK